MEHHSSLLGTLNAYDTGMACRVFACGIRSLMCPPTVVSSFYHKEIKKSAMKGKLAMPEFLKI